MTTDTLYLDHAATTAIRPQVVDVMTDAMRNTNANASGLHGPARAAKNALEQSRERAAELLGADRPLNIIFTSGGTESDNLAIAGRMTGTDRNTVITSAVEHDAVRETAGALADRGFMHRTVGVDAQGRVDPRAVAEVCDESVGIVSVMTANNEIGTIQPVAEIAAAVHAVDDDIVVHTDAVQAFVSENVRLDVLGVDALSLAGHKFGGPKGVGLLAVRDEIDLQPVSFGGGQEAGRRSGTYNVPAIVGMVHAMELTVADRDRFRRTVEAERDAFERTLTSEFPDIVVNGRDADRLVQHSHCWIPGVLAETLLIRMDQAGIAAAAGSACQSGAVEPSHVLLAMGMSERAAGECVRFSFGWTTAPGDGSSAAKRVASVVGDLR